MCVCLCVGVRLKIEALDCKFHSSCDWGSLPLPQPSNFTPTPTPNPSPRHRHHYLPSLPLFLWVRFTWVWAGMPWFCKVGWRRDHVAREGGGSDGWAARTDFIGQKGDLGGSWLEEGLCRGHSYLSDAARANLTISHLWEKIFRGRNPRNVFIYIHVTSNSSSVRCWQICRSGLKWKVTGSGLWLSQDKNIFCVVEEVNVSRTLCRIQLNEVSGTSLLFQDKDTVHDTLRTPTRLPINPAITGYATEGIFLISLHLSNEIVSRC